MKPKREKREWVKHELHCRCDVALEEALAALENLISLEAPLPLNESWFRAKAALAKYGKSSGETGKKGESRTGRRHTRRSSAAAPQSSMGAPETEPGANQITPQQELRSAELAHWNMRTAGSWEG